MAAPARHGASGIVGSAPGRSSATRLVRDAGTGADRRARRRSACGSSPSRAARCGSATRSIRSAAAGRRLLPGPDRARRRRLDAAARADQRLGDLAGRHDRAAGAQRRQRCRARAVGFPPPRGLRGLRRRRSTSPASSTRAVRRRALRSSCGSHELAAARRGPRSALRLRAADGGRAHAPAPPRRACTPRCSSSAWPPPTSSRHGGPATSDVRPTARAGREAVADDRLAYLDHAATTPLRPEAVEAMRPCLAERLRQPVGRPPRWPGRPAGASTRPATTWPRLLGCAPGEVVFTSGGTEADNLAVARRARRRAGGAWPCARAIEHHAVLDPVAARSAARSSPSTPPGVVDLDALAAAARRPATSPSCR